MDDCPNPFVPAASLVLNQFAWPAVVSARWQVIGMDLHIFLTFDRVMDITAPPNPTHFAVTVGGIAKTMIAPSWLDSLNLDLSVSSYGTPADGVNVSLPAPVADVISDTAVMANAFQIENVQPS